MANYNGTISDDILLDSLRFCSDTIVNNTPDYLTVCGLDDVNVADSGTHKGQLPVSMREHGKDAHLVKSFVDDYYNRIHVDPLILNFGAIISPLQEELMVWNAYFVAKTCSQIVEVNGDNLIPVSYGALGVRARSPIGERLSYLYDALLTIMGQHQPEAVAVENFMAKNVRAALTVGRAQAVAILAATKQGIPLYEYTPAQVKQRVADYGASTKEQVQEMVRLQLGLPQVPEPSDAADALAVALCHLRETHLDNLLARNRKEIR